jgi:RNA polymerase sigma-70 factor (ECF subfamily)
MKTATTIPINELILGCKLGDRHMQQALYHQTSAKMFAICLRYAKDRMEAEDVLQMGFIKIFNHIKEFRADGVFEGWMKKIMVNTAIESFRKNKRNLTIVAMEETHELPLIGFDYHSLGVQDLMKLVENLADGYRIVFNMYAIEGYSHKEIAQTLGISEGASKSQLSRARAILQKEIIKMEGYNYATHTG